MPANTHSIDVRSHDFPAEVIERSMDLPVVVVFWGGWSEPCKEFLAILDRLATEADGAFRLARVDVEAAPELMEAMRLQTVPTVILFQEGRPVDGFSGVLPEKDLRDFLGTHISLEAEIDPADAAEALIEAGEIEEARELLEVILEGDPQSEKARSLMAKLDLEAKAGDLVELEARVAGNPEDLRARIELGQALVAAGRTEQGLEALYEAALRDIHFEDDAPRKALIEVFQMIGFGDPLSIDYQQRLSVLLCS